MNWREAHTIGNKAEGIIKCTYARIYDKAGKALFSLQRVDAEDHPVLAGNAQTGDLYMIGREADERTVFQWTEGWSHEGEKAQINFDLPLVVTAGVADGKLVPATLTDKAREILISSLQNTKKVIRYDIYRVWDITTGNEHKAGDREKVAQQYSNQIPEKYKQSKATYHYERESVNVLRPTYQTLIDILDRGDVVYIKPAAYDWEPLDIKATDLDDEIAKAKRRMDAAKAALIAAGVATII